MSRIQQQRKIAEEILQLVKKREIDLQRFRDRIRHLAEQKIDQVILIGNTIPEEERKIVQLCERLANSIRADYPNETFD